ncbi:MAG: trigger factor [Chlamydiae bacterium CG10_big_fil_rev_8_21_14_0_10_35_9]|nr:MAG: trigger factor [Chlamydiae bacterium CG10_big_fil_rev_8_21_14_0_10_35_9]
MAKTDNLEEISTDHLKIKINKLPLCKVELSVHADPEFVKTAHKKAAKEVSKQVSIPGFRKGKAPIDTIIKKYGGAVEEKLSSVLADEAFKECQKATKLKILSNGPKITYDAKSISLENGADLTYKFEEEPTVPSIDPLKFKPTNVKAPKVTKKEIDEAIHQTKFYYADWKEITDRSAKEGDYVLLDIETTEEPKQKVFQDTRFEISDKRMAKWMQELVIGSKTNDSIEGTSKPDPDVSEKEKKEFEPKNVKVTIKKIEEATLPNLDDEFAKKLGVESVEKLKESVEKMLKDQAQEKYEKDKREAVNKFLTDTYQFDLPESLVQKEIDFRFSQLMENPKTKKEYETFSDKEKQRQMDNLKQQSIDAVRLFYLSRKIVSDAKINVTYDDVVKEALLSLQQYGHTKIDPKSIPQEVYALAFSKVMLKKAQDYIFNQNEKQT